MVPLMNEAITTTLTSQQSQTWFSVKSYSMHPPSCATWPSVKRKTIC